MAVRLEKYNNRVERCILFLRVFNTGLLLGALCILLFKFVKVDERLRGQDPSDKVDEIQQIALVLACISIGVIALQLVSNAVLIRYLNRKERVMAEKLDEEASVYSGEKCKLIFICCAFCVSFFIDIVYDAFAIKRFTG